MLDQYSNVYEQTVYITYQGVDGPAEIVSNKIHPFFVVFGDDDALPPASSEGHVYDGPITGGAWVDAANLRIGDTLRGPDGTLRPILDIQIKDQPLTAYNLSVENLHTFFVTGHEAESSIWVHNTCDVSKQLGTDKPAQAQGAGEPSGNSMKSTKAQHGYVIYDTQEKMIAKVGISGGNINNNGSSRRANAQVNRWNKEPGNKGRYRARVVEKVPEGQGARQEISDWEKATADKLRDKEELDPDRHRRP